MVGAGGLVASIIAFAVGAILNYAVTVNPDQHGFNVNKVGVILMIVGVAEQRYPWLRWSSPIRAAAVPSSTTGRATWYVEWIRRIDGGIYATLTQGRICEMSTSRTKGLCVMSTVDKAKNKIQEAKGHLK